MLETTSQPTNQSTTKLLNPGLRRVILMWHAFERTLAWAFMKFPANRVTFLFDEHDLVADVTYVIVSNHQSRFDPFVELASFSRPVYRRIGPIRSMTLNRFFGSGIVGYSAIRMGCFPARAHPSLPSGIDFAAELVERGQSVFICPEGGRTLPGTGSARPGVAILANLPKVLLIPARIQWRRHGKIGRSFKLTMGQPYSGSGMTAPEILDTVYALPL
jgi:1-acyl-sn-glycerol-3-phosphate acyltransferase